MTSTNDRVKITDAKRDLVIHVTKADIRNATRSENKSCAVARALCRQENYKQAIVNKSRTVVQLKDGSWQRYITPENLYVELMVFDRGGEMQPDDYVLKAPKGSLRLGHHAKPKGPHLKTNGARKRHVIENVREDAKRGIAMYKSLEE